VWISAQRASFTLHVINWLVFITVVESVYNAIRSNSLYKADYASYLKGWGELWLDSGKSQFLLKKYIKTYTRLGFDFNNDLAKWHNPFVYLNALISANNCLKWRSSCTVNTKSVHCKGILHLCYGIIHNIQNILVRCDVQEGVSHYTVEPNPQHIFKVKAGGLYEDCYDKRGVCGISLTGIHATVSRNYIRRFFFVNDT
jgi:hypothetical protein